jgi:hypothetical protein
MNTHRVQGLALILGGVFSFAYLISDSTPVQYLGILAILLFIFGIPAVHVSQPSGWVGWIGIGLVILSAVIALGFGVGILGGTNFDGALIAISAFSGVVGRLIVGWLTIQKRVFPQWIGWAFIIEGLVILVGFLDITALSSIVALAVTLAGAAAQFGYGFHIFRETKS